MKRYSGMIDRPFAFGIKKRDWATGKIMGLDVSGMTELSKEQLFSRYGISDEYVMYSAVLVSGDSLSKDEVIVIKAMDEGSACSVRDCLDKYYKSVLRESKEYLPDEYEKLEKASVVKDGIYVRLFISDKADEMNKIYNSYEK